jgi:hypothetical protein
LTFVKQCVDAPLHVVGDYGYGRKIWSGARDRAGIGQVEGR